METISVRVMGALLAAVMVSSCNGNDVGNCTAVYQAGRWCWEGVTRDICDSQDGHFTSKSCLDLGYGCPDVQQYQAPEVCAERCGAANLHLAACGIGALFDCSGGAALRYKSCVTACATAKPCDELQGDPLAVCDEYCAGFDAGLRLSER
jgi:hypothetical protein